MSFYLDAASYKPFDWDTYSHSDISPKVGTVRTLPVFNGPETRVHRRRLPIRRTHGSFTEDDVYNNPVDARGVPIRKVRPTRAPSSRPPTRSPVFERKRNFRTDPLAFKSSRQLYKVAKLVHNYDYSSPLIRYYPSISKSGNRIYTPRTARPILGDYRVPFNNKTQAFVKNWKLSTMPSRLAKLDLHLNRMYTGAKSAHRLIKSQPSHLQQGLRDQIGYLDHGL